MVRLGFFVILPGNSGEVAYSDVRFGEAWGKGGRTLVGPTIFPLPLQNSGTLRGPMLLPWPKVELRNVQ